MKYYFEKQDVEFGLHNEKVCKQQIENYFNTQLNHTLGRYDLFDYENENYKVELKSRRCNFKTYKTTMIGKNKIEYWLKNKDKKIFLIFLMVCIFVN
jgi:hypothetical protein